MTFRIEWFCTEVLVQLGDNIEHYMMIPEAKLYQDGILINDPDIEYIRDGVERTFKSVINTNIVKSYILKFRVTFPTYGQSSVQPISFQVIDEIPPVIDHLPVFHLPIGQKLPMLSDGLLYHDNYDTLQNISVHIDSSRIILTKIGTYPIIYQIRDLSGNLTERTSYLTIYDHLPPDISVKKEIVLSFGSAILWRDFFLIHDNYDLAPDVYLDDTNVDYNHLGTYPFSITAIDSSGLSSTLFEEVSIIDTMPPVVLLKSTPAPISVGKDLSSIDFLSYIVSIFDDYDYLTDINVEISHDIEFQVIGTYKIYYQVTDSSGNSTEKVMSIKVSDLTAPVITIDIPFIYEVFSAEPHLLNQFSFSDNYSKTEEMTCKVTATYKMNIVADYPITIEVSDKSGNKTIYRDYIRIVDIFPPDIIQLNDIIITDFQRKDLHFYFSALDNYDIPSKIKISIDDFYVNYEKIGSYPLRLSATDQSGNVKFMESEVIVIDMTQPMLTLTALSISVDVGSSELDLKHFIDLATDNYDELNPDAVIIFETIDYQQLGVYPVIYQLKDSSLNTFEQTLYVTVDDRQAPIVKFSNLALSLGSPFNPLEGIQVEEQSESYTIKYFPYFLDVSTPGNKTITYVITDSRGNYTVSHRIIEVLPESSHQSIISFIPVILITLIGAGASYYFWKKMY